MTFSHLSYVAVLALALGSAIAEAQQTPPPQRTIRVYSDEVLEGSQAQTLSDRFEQVDVLVPEFLARVRAAAKAHRGR
jgi:hypothetical protein